MYINKMFSSAVVTNMSATSPTSPPNGGFTQLQNKDIIEVLHLQSVFFTGINHIINLNHIIFL